MEDMEVQQNRRIENEKYYVSLVKGRRYINLSFLH
jgi:hypothetical protein